MGDGGAQQPQQLRAALRPPRAKWQQSAIFDGDLHSKQRSGAVSRTRRGPTVTIRWGVARIAAIAMALPWVAAQVLDELDRAGADRLTALAVIYALSVGVAALAWHERRRDRGLAAPTTPVRQWLMIVAATTVAFFLAALTGLIGTAGVDVGPQVPDRTAAGVLSVVVGASIVPLVEEIVFRGGIGQACRRLSIPEGSQRWPEGGRALRTLWFPITASSVLFGLAHYQVATLIGMGSLVLFGIVMAIAYEFTGRLWVPILVHATYNLGGGLNDLALPAILLGLTVPAMVAMAALVAIFTGPPAPRGFVGSGRDLHPFNTVTEPR